MGYPLAPERTSVEIPIAIAPFKGQESAAQKPSQIVSADLERSGQFRSTDPGVSLDEKTLPDFTSIRQKNADALLTGSVNKLADGRLDVRFRLWDVVKGQDLGGRSFAVTAPDLRLAPVR